MHQHLPTAEHSSAGSALAKTYRAFLAEKNCFCEKLEALADLLPDKVDPQDCLLIAQNTLPLMLRAHTFEEQVVFPYLDRDPNLPDSARQSLEQLKFEHMGDEDYANDICVALRDFVMNRNRANPEALSWMLRGFFLGLRRHVAFEKALLLPLMEARDQ
jgi:iron-sulfur cluster repair protein YtfE (RIC family)